MPNGKFQLTDVDDVAERTAKIQARMKLLTKMDIEAGTRGNSAHGKMTLLTSPDVVEVMKRTEPDVLAEMIKLLLPTVRAQIFDQMTQLRDRYGIVLDGMDEFAPASA